VRVNKDNLILGILEYPYVYHIFYVNKQYYDTNLKVDHSVFQL